jgi:hypothetical protein
MGAESLDSLRSTLDIVRSFPLTPRKAAAASETGKEGSQFGTRSAELQNPALCESGIRDQSDTCRSHDKMFPEVPPLEARVDDVEIWSVKNDTEMDHPFHLHGMFFQVLDVEGKAPEHLGWKDTVNIPQKKTLRFAVRYGTAGRWMYHCHILEHAERGMMGELVLASGN